MIFIDILQVKIKNIPFLVSIVIDMHRSLLLLHFRVRTAVQERPFRTPFDQIPGHRIRNLHSEIYHGIVVDDLRTISGGALWFTDIKGICGGFNTQ